MKKLLLVALGLLFTLPLEAAPLQMLQTNPAPANVQKIDNERGQGWRRGWRDDDRGVRRDNRRHWRGERQGRRHMRREARRDCYRGECYGRRYNNYGDYNGRRPYRQNGGSFILQF